MLLQLTSFYAPATWSRKTPHFLRFTQPTLITNKNAKVGLREIVYSFCHKK